MAADFLPGFPTTDNGSNAVLHIVDKLSKRVMQVTTNKELTAMEVAKVFHGHLFSKHGIPVIINLDRDKLFASKYFK